MTVNRDRQELDDQVSARCFDAFLKTLDPLKLYFMQADIDELSRFRTELDDMIVKRGDISFGYTVFKRYLQRLDERVALVDRLLTEKPDFTIDEEMITDGDAATWAKTEEEVHDRWRKRVKFDFLVLKADDKEKFDWDKARERLARRYHSLSKRWHQTKSDDLLEIFMTSFTMSLDPHTTYMSPTTLKNFEIDMRKKLQGIGAALMIEDGYTVINRIVPGGPADKDKRLKPTDRVIGVAQGEKGEIVDVVDMRLSDVVDLIRGDKGTVVRLQVLPGGTGAPVIYSLTRAEIELVDSIARSQIFEEGKKPDGKPYKIGVIDLPSFYMDMEAARKRLPDYRSTTRDVAKLLDQFQADGVDVVVLDLRRNGGGSLKEAVDLTGLFIDRGPVVLVKDAKGSIDHYDDSQPGMKWSGPLVVLTSKFSASASEIFAGAILDYRRGLVVGDHTTHGKGTVQSLLDVGEFLFRIPGRNLGALKITQQQFYRPSGLSTQKRGVKADIELPALTTHLKGVSESDLDYAVEFDQIEPTPYDKADLVSLPLLAELKTRSQKRIEKSPDFAKLERRIKFYQERKERKRVTLNEEKYLAERKELDAEKEIEKALLEDNDPQKPVVKRDYYFNEVLALATDYCEQLAKIHRDGPQLGARN